MDHRRKLAAMLAGAALLLGSLASSAAAHVTVNPDGEAAKGGFARLAFRVPNESDTARTTSLAVQFPADHPLSSVSVLPKPGWTYQVATRPLDPPVEREEGSPITEAVDTVTWTSAAGGGINPGEFDEFVVSAGPLPTDADSLAFPTVQTKTSPDGTTEEVRWNQPTPAGGDEPERPAPTLTLVEGGDDGHGGDDHGGAEASDASGGTGDETAAADDHGDEDDDHDEGSETLAIVAVVVAGLALLASGAALVRGRKA